MDQVLPKAFFSWSTGKDCAFALVEVLQLNLAEIVGRRKLMMMSQATWLAREITRLADVRDEAELCRFPTQPLLRQSAGCRHI
jgi:hypothetical protein